jgi:hypothetical protein
MQSEGVGNLALNWKAKVRTWVKKEKIVNKIGISIHSLDFVKSCSGA